MTVVLNQLGQISLAVDDVDAAEEFYDQKLGLRKLYRFGDLVFFDCAGVRLFLEKSRSQPFIPNGSFLYFRTPDITVAVRELQAKGVSFIDKPHLIAPMKITILDDVFQGSGRQHIGPDARKRRRATSRPATRIFIAETPSSQRSEFF
jgi:methylmalonyl-CoA/ethylmalonyl-CoA epimerase